MPLVLTDTASIVINDHLVRKPLREKVAVTSVSVPEQSVSKEIEGTIRAQVVSVKTKKATSSYRQDLLTSQK
jgi:hypothetical protein